MKLDRQEIQFIENYLKNSGVEYIDIRYEMTDHVATALEEMDGGLEDNFKEYMLRHKQELLASNRQFSKIAGRRATRLLLGNLIRPRFLATAAILFLLMYLFPVNTDVLRTGYTIFAIMLFVFYRYAGWATTNLKFSVIDKVHGSVAVVIYILVLFIRPERWLENNIALIAFFAGFTAFIIEVLLTFRELMKKYKLQYGS